MELIRGPKPLTEIERAVAAELHRALKPELEMSAHGMAGGLSYRRHCDAEDKSGCMTATEKGRIANRTWLDRKMFGGRSAVS